MKKAVMAVGNVLRGDDSIGQMILQQLKGIDADLVDLGWGLDIGPIKKYDRVAIVDAGLIGGKPGDWGSFSLKELKPGSILSTHGISIDFLIRKMDNIPELRFFLIQPGEFSAKSIQTHRKIPEIIKAIKNYLDQS